MEQHSSAVDEGQEDWQRFWHVLSKVNSPHTKPDLAAFGDLLIRSGVKERSYGKSTNKTKVPCMTAHSSTHAPGLRALRQSMTQPQPHDADRTSRTMQEGALMQAATTSWPPTATNAAQLPVASSAAATNDPASCSPATAQQSDTPAAPTQLSGAVLQGALYYHSPKDLPCRSKGSKVTSPRPGTAPAARTSTLQATRRLLQPAAAMPRACQASEAGVQPPQHTRSALPHAPARRQPGVVRTHTPSCQGADGTEPEAHTVPADVKSVPVTPARASQRQVAAEAYNVEVPRGLPGTPGWDDLSLMNSPRPATNAAPAPAPASGRYAVMQSVGCGVLEASGTGAAAQAADSTARALYGGAAAVQAVFMETLVPVGPCDSVPDPQNQSHTGAGVPEGGAAGGACPASARVNVPQLPLQGGGGPRLPSNAVGATQGQGLSAGAGDSGAVWGGLLANSGLLDSLLSATAAGAGQHVGAASATQVHGKRRPRHAASRWLPTNLPTPHARWEEIQLGIARLAKRQAVLSQTGNKEPKQPQEGSLQAWGSAWKDSLAAELQEVIPRTPGATAGHRTQLMQKVAALMSDHRTAGPGGQTAALNEQEAAVRDVNKSLQLLDVFNMICPQPQRHRLADQVTAAATARRDPITGLRVLPPPPPAFPSSAAWDYLVASQVALGGLAELEETVNTMRDRIRVMTGSQGLARGLAASSALSAVEQHLGVAELAAVRSVSTPRTYNVSECADSPLVSRATTPRQTAPTSTPHTPPPASLVPPLSPRRSPRPPVTPSSKQTLQETNQGVADTACAAEGLMKGDSAALEEMWSWLESLMIEMHATDGARTDLEHAARLAAAEQRRQEPVSNPHTTEAPPLTAVTNIVEQVAKLRAALSGTGDDAKAALAHLTGQLPHTDQAALRAATLSHFSPANLERVLHFVLQLASCMERGVLPAQDSGFLLIASTELLMGELRWLLALLRAASGPASPHLRALHAALRAHDAQAEYNVILAERVDQLHREFGGLMTRARSAESKAEALEGQMEVLQQSHVALTAHNRELDRDNDKLMERVQQLEAEVHRLNSDVDVHERRTMQRAETLKQAELFRQVSRSWHMGAVSTMSKGVQVDMALEATEDVAADVGCPSPSASKARRSQRSMSGAGSRKHRISAVSSTTTGTPAQASVLQHDAASLPPALVHA